MLVLSRTKGQTIICKTSSGEDLEITVVDVKGGCVKVGIKADRETVIHRKEVFERIKKENK